MRLLIKSGIIGQGEVATRPFRVVLYKWGEEYVTWLESIDDKSRYWGHYFSGEQEAYEDFLARMKKYTHRLTV